MSRTKNVVYHVRIVPDKYYSVFLLMKSFLTDTETCIRARWSTGSAWGKGKDINFKVRDGFHPSCSKWALYPGRELALIYSPIRTRRVAHRESILQYLIDDISCYSS